MKTVTIIDYGIGNLFSVVRAVGHIGARAVITGDPETVSNAECLIIPGVGAFVEGIENLKNMGLVDPINAVAASRPVMGICLGMQLLMTESEEMGMHRGLDLISGRVLRFPDPAPTEGRRSYKVPNIGWSELYRPPHIGTWEGTILDGLHEGESMYFVHSYVVVPDDPSCILAHTTYGGLTYCSVIGKNNMYGCQFHPEKSGKPGLEILRKFLSL